MPSGFCDVCRDKQTQALVGEVAPRAPGLRFQTWSQEADRIPRNEQGAPRGATSLSPHPHAPRSPTALKCLVTSGHAFAVPCCTGLGPSRGRSRVQGGPVLCRRWTNGMSLSATLGSPRACAVKVALPPAAGSPGPSGKALAVHTPFARCRLPGNGKTGASASTGGPAALSPAGEACSIALSGGGKGRCSRGAGRCGGNVGL